MRILVLLFLLVAMVIAYQSGDVALTKQLIYLFTGYLLGVTISDMDD